MPGDEQGRHGLLDRYGLLDRDGLQDRDGSGLIGANSPFGVKTKTGKRAWPEPGC